MAPPTGVASRERAFSVEGVPRTRPRNSLPAGVQALPHRHLVSPPKRHTRDLGVLVAKLDDEVRRTPVPSFTSRSRNTDDSRVPLNLPVEPASRWMLRIFRARRGVTPAIQPAHRRHRKATVLAEAPVRKRPGLRERGLPAPCVRILTESMCSRWRCSVGWAWLRQCARTGWRRNPTRPGPTGARRSTPSRSIISPARTTTGGLRRHRGRS